MTKTEFLKLYQENTDGRHNAQIDEIVNKLYAPENEHKYKHFTKGFESVNGVIKKR